MVSTCGTPDRRRHTCKIKPHQNYARNHCNTDLCLRMAICEHMLLTRWQFSASTCGNLDKQGQSCEMKKFMRKLERHQTWKKIGLLEKPFSCLFEAQKALLAALQSSFRIRCCCSNNSAPIELPRLYSLCHLIVISQRYLKLRAFSKKLSRNSQASWWDFCSSLSYSPLL